ncbi:hypothetical protein CVT26_015414 [Gymnopilus dilepis]|uniref:Uncharacterized protein n=1 Tax=Gymnopilus dilepis TaxID=231916 RepID=A0A409YEF6_9AGAR|nr:hypothetical protein CVT26_015414 [Gymnopilus dilepis]
MALFGYAGIVSVTWEYRFTSNAPSDDISRIKSFLVKWLYEEILNLSPPLEEDDREDRGLSHDMTGRLLCPVEFDWDDLEVRAKLRAGGDEKFDWLSSFHSRIFFSKFKGDRDHLEDGFLKSIILVKSIFTSPSSAAEVIDSEAEEDLQELGGERPKKRRRKSKAKKNKTSQRTVATILEMNSKVTPRSIAYVATIVHFNLGTAERWTSPYTGFDYGGLYDYIVDYFEDINDEETKERSEDLPKWWTRKVFPNAPSNRDSATTNSRNTMKAQRAARSAALRAEKARSAAARQNSGEASSSATRRSSGEARSAARA